MNLFKSAVIAAVLGVSITVIGCQTNGKELTQESPKVKFVVTDAMQTKFYDTHGNIIEEPEPGDPLYGQDAQYEGIRPLYTDNGDGTVTDDNTGLMWQQTPPKDKMTYDEAMEYVEKLELGGYTDWRLPTIKESFSLANLDGQLNVGDTNQSVPYIDSDYFDFFYDEGRPYTGSYWTSSVTRIPAENEYEEMEKNYGFNWADGHLKSYGDGYSLDGSTSGSSIPAGVRAVRGEEGVYGVNDFTDNRDGTITDQATGLMWSQKDSGAVNDDGTLRSEDDENFGLGRTWVDTLVWVQNMNAAQYLGYSDWRLPDAKELQSIVQYGISELPATDSDYFDLSRTDSYMWTSTTCGDFPDTALYFAFGKAYGINLMTGGVPAGQGPEGGEQMGPPPEDVNDPMENEVESFVTVDATVADFVDTHGPGAMRNDYKDVTGTATQAPALSRELWSKLYGEEYPYDFDPSDETTLFDLSASENAADYIVLYNYALLVRDAD
ncbi:DUF1566 domain-containing protein [Oceanispirochaeta crateris]|uniref:DUF1566 domain-containing protein n=1 Tax=Oceanispirochaeta crateris TaxID=2518645 RepID=A0A5C1QMS7_9SPIO|nr:DUF1566 domain-containing protein [Oceanispirochaeta crateris]QEN08971.1 DUF1566 domain-containing protein [Oceanispirochaeta crateris]